MSDKTTITTSDSGHTGDSTADGGTALERTHDGRQERKRLTRLALGKLPNAMRGAGKTADALRMALEAAVEDRHGSISLAHACLISTAARWERHGAIAAWLFRIHEATMTHSERITYSREIARASTERDKAIAALRLERNEQDVFDALYASPAFATRDIAPASASAATPPSDASNAAVER